MYSNGFVKSNFDEFFEALNSLKLSLDLQKHALDGFLALNDVIY
jgi:hypothetical protein